MAYRESFKMNFCLDKDAERFSGIEQCFSPNYDQRPIGAEIELLVIHGISLPPRKFGGMEIIDLFTNSLDVSAHPSFEGIASNRVSAHLLIRRDGQVIQFVSFKHRAWHAGNSVFRGRTSCNDFSIGIELEGYDDIAYEKKQYIVLAGITKTLQKHWPKITATNIVGHSDISPGRKTDPGPFFDWNFFFGLL